MESSIGDSRDEESLISSRVTEEKAIFEEPSDKLWSTYVMEAEKHDRALAEIWKGDMDGILIFAGLFSAVVTAFAIESIRDLQQDNGIATVTLLTQISQQLSVLASGDSSVKVPSSTELGLNNFEPRQSTVWVNALWITSLVFSISGALGSTLIQQWARNYLQSVLKHPVPHRRGRIRSFLFEGIQTFRMAAVAEIVPFLLHLSVFFFLYGLAVFLHPIHLGLSYFTLALTTAVTTLYLATTIFPIIFAQCPFGTPLSPMFWACISATVRFYRHSAVHVQHGAWKFRKSAARNIKPYPGARKSRVSGSMAQAKEDRAIADHPDRSARDRTALTWAVESTISDSGTEAFIDGIPGFLESEHVRGGASIIRHLLSQGLGKRLSQLLRGCVDSKTLSDIRRRQRALSCMNAIRAVTVDSRDDTWCWTTVFGVPTAKALYRLQQDESPLVSLYALCTTAVVSCRLYRELLHPEISAALWFSGRKDVLLREQLMESVTRDYIANHHALKALHTTKDSNDSPSGESWIQISAQRQRFVDAIAGNRLKISRFGGVGMGNWYSMTSFASSRSSKQIQEEVSSYYRDVAGFTIQRQRDGVRSGHLSTLAYLFRCFEVRNDGLDGLEVAIESTRFITKGLHLQHAGLEIQENLIELAESISLPKTGHDDGTTSRYYRPSPEILHVIFHCLRHLSHPTAREEAKVFLQNYINSNPAHQEGPATWSLAMLTQFEQVSAAPGSHHSEMALVNGT